MTRTRDGSLARIRDRAHEFAEYACDPSPVCPLFPEHIHIEPTNACNLRCVHCHQSAAGTHFTKRRTMMRLELFRKVIDEIAGRSARITLDAQGEPLLHRDILEMIAYAKNSGLSVSLITNATRLTPEKTERILELETDRVVFSFEGSTAEIYERVRRRSRYLPTLRNILHFLKRNDELGRPTFVCMSMVEHRHTRDDVQAYREYFGALPIDTIFVNPLLNMSGASPIATQDVDLDSLLDSDRAGEIVCRLPWENLMVNSDGSVSPCAVDYNESHVVGDANTESLVEIWNGERMRRFRRCHLTHDFDWIEADGALCGACNCRFGKDYDLLDAEGYLARYVDRQSDVHADDRGRAERAAHYENACRELARVEALLRRAGAHPPRTRRQGETR